MLEPKYRVWNKREEKMTYTCQHTIYHFMDIVYKPYLIYLPSLGFVDSANQTVYLEDIYEYRGRYCFIPREASFEILAHIKKDFNQGATVVGNRFENPKLVEEVKSQYEG